MKKSMKILGYTLSVILKFPSTKRNKDTEEDEFSEWDEDDEK